MDLFIDARFGMVFAHAGGVAFQPGLGRGGTASMDSVQVLDRQHGDSSLIRLNVGCYDAPLAEGRRDSRR